MQNQDIIGHRIDGDERVKWGIRQRGITVLDPTTVSPTITGAPDDYLHYSEPRIMTVRECARIQSFPDWYEFKSKYTTGGEMRKKEVPRYSQVGNAIPPLLLIKQDWSSKKCYHEEKGWFKVSSEIKNILGRDLITDSNIAVLELVKNSYDAYAKRVTITFDNDSLIISDDGKE